MKKLLVLLIACAIPFATANACTAFFKHGYVSGLNRICIYNHLGSDAAMTVRAHEICPITVFIPH